jgi:plastocyanin
MKGGEMLRLLTSITVMAALTLGVASCSGSSGAETTTATPGNAPPSPAPTTAAPAGATPNGAPTTVTLVAKNLAFDKDEIDVPANANVTVTLDNQDAAVLHNFSVYDSKALTEKVAVGDFVTGPATKDYAVPPLKAGTYYFRCDVHPDTMNGSYVVK